MTNARVFSRIPFQAFLSVPLFPLHRQQRQRKELFKLEIGGQPNPFVAPSYRRRVTHQIEILEIFDDYRRMPSRDLT